MKRRSLRNDPISTSERERGAIVVQMLFDLDQAVPAARTEVPEAAPTQPAQK